MSYIASALRVHYPRDKLHILVPKSNSDSFTYDGIDLGGDRVIHEIEKYIEYLRQQGKSVRKLSVVGYSLGGLIARYVIGILHSKGFFKHVEPINFTTFAAPHLGVRTPVTSFRSRLFNWLGSQTLSLSGRQLFIVDSFRDTGRPLLCILADTDTVFMQALRSFPHRILYANIVNDRSAPYYTTSISFSDPFSSLDRVDLHYLAGYAPNILDPDDPYDIFPEKDRSPFLSRLVTSCQSLLPQIPWFTWLAFIFTIGIPIFLCNAFIQSFRSSRRIRLYEENQSGTEFSHKTFSMIHNARAAAGSAFKDVNVKQKPSLDLPGDTPECQADDSEINHGEDVTDERNPLARHNTLLPLSSEQFAMIRNLDTIRFTKFRVHIHKARHSHAAIIVRPRPAGEKAFGEGKIIVKHWLEREFKSP